MLGIAHIHSGLEPAGNIYISEHIGPNGILAVGRSIAGNICVGGHCEGLLALPRVVEGACITVKGSVSGIVHVTGGNDFYGVLDIQGNLEGEIAFLPPMGGVRGSNLGQINIHGSMYNNIQGDEITVGESANGGTICIDYDGWDEADSWESGATININGDIYYGNSPEANIYEVTDCRGDLDNDGYLTETDVSIVLDVLYAQGGNYDPSEYVASHPELAGSLHYHADSSGNGTIDAQLGGPDENAVTYLGGEHCCVRDWSFCVTDIDCDGDTDMTDLSILLSHYGMTSGVDREDGDIDGDGDVDLADLATLLGQYGESCDCPGAEDGGGGGGDTDGSYADISVEAYDTGGYSGQGFAGESSHFVFDLEMEVLDPNTDDWIATGVRLSTFNDATFRLSSTATTPDAYATFVAAPWTSLPGSATASVAGAYAPASQSATFTTSAINLGWYDCASSNDGPATMMRIVIDVTQVDGADVSGGFGSVYFGAPKNLSDIKVATLIASGTYTAGSAPAEESLAGDFWVTGE